MELVINTFGTSLNRDNEGFVVTNQDGRQRVPVQGIRSIQIGKGAQITSDAVMLAIDHEIDIIFTDRTGMPKGRIWSPNYGSISTIRKGQLTFSASEDALSWIKGILLQKIANQQALLLMLPEPVDPKMERLLKHAIDQLENYRGKILDIAEPQLVRDVAATLRGLEGMASKVYFDTINLFLPESYRFACRSQHPAMDIFNAMLNYGYGLLYAKVEGELIKAGVDPYIGILHRDEYSRPVLAFDVIEIYRIWVDYVVCNLALQEVVTEEYYSVQSDGSCWLESLGRRVMIQSVNDYMEEVVQLKNVSRSRNTQVQLYAQELAQRFKKYM